MANYKGEKSLFCIECNDLFTDDKPFWAQNKCNVCYQRLYRQGQLTGKKEKPTNCIKCDGVFDTLNEKGKPINRAPKGFCRKCYGIEHKQTRFCRKCNNEMIAKSYLGLCVICKLDRPVKKGRKKKELPYVEYEEFELIRRLLVRYKVGHNTLLDTFRVADVYMEVNNNPILLDTLSEEVQLIEMLRNLKAIFEYNVEYRKNNKPVKKKKEKLTSNMKAYRKDWYRKNRETVLKKKREEYGTAR